VDDSDHSRVVPAVRRHHHHNVVVLLLLLLPRQRCHGTQGCAPHRASQASRQEGERMNEQHPHCVRQPAAGL